MTVSQSPEERLKGKILSKHKRVLIEVGLASADSIRVDYRRGVRLINRSRVGQWETSSEKLQLDKDKLREVGIDVEVCKLEAAVAELMRG